MLVLYSTDSAICQLFDELSSASGTTLANAFYYNTGYKTGYPWLYYDRDYPSQMSALHFAFTYTSVDLNYFACDHFQLEAFNTIKVCPINYHSMPKKLLVVKFIMDELSGNVKSKLRYD